MIYEENRYSAAMETKHLSDLEFQLRCERALWRVAAGNLSASARGLARALRAAALVQGRPGLYECAYQKMLAIRRQGAEQQYFHRLAPAGFYSERSLATSYEPPRPSGRGVFRDKRSELMVG